jgi:hypothetical protein
VEGYNIHWFDENDKPDAKTPPTFGNVISKDFGIKPECNSDTETTSDDNSNSHPVPTLRQVIESSVDKLFFIAYRSPNTLRPRWWLVQVDLEQTEKLSNAEKINKTTYYCHFFSPPDNNEKKESHPGCRWWPIWHEYSTDNGMIVFGKQVRITPSRIPNSEKYIAWADKVDLGNPAICLLGPFDFLNPSSCPSTKHTAHRQFVPLSLWQELYEICSTRGIAPPRLLKPKARGRKRKNDQE